MSPLPRLRHCSASISLLDPSLHLFYTKTSWPVCLSVIQYHTVFCHNLLVRKQVGRYFNRQSVAVHQPSGQTLNLRKFILKEKTEGKQFTVIKICLCPSRAVLQGLHHCRRLKKPLPGHTDDSKELKVEGGVSQKDFRSFLFLHPHQMSGHLLKHFQRLFEFLHV